MTVTGPVRASTLIGMAVMYAIEAADTLGLVTVYLHDLPEATREHLLEQLVTDHGFQRSASPENRDCKSAARGPVSVHTWPESS